MSHFEFLEQQYLEAAVTLQDIRTTSADGTHRSEIGFRLEPLHGYGLRRILLSAPSAPHPYLITHFSECLDDYLTYMEARAKEGKALPAELLLLRGIPETVRVFPFVQYSQIKPFKMPALTELYANAVSGGQQLRRRKDRWYWGPVSPTKGENIQRLLEDSRRA